MEDKLVIPWEGWKAVKKLGSGGFGTVYEIERDFFGITEKAALKVITIPQNPDEIEYMKCEGNDAKSITRRFRGYLEDIAKEYSAMAQMKGSVHIVHCDDFKSIQHDDGFGYDIYIKMELLTPLMQALDKVKQEEQIIQLGLDISKALIHCQKKKILHRDIKPQNVFIAEDGVFKLGDFGIARNAEQVTNATVGVGSFSFMAPEVFLGKPGGYDHRADVYSLGLLLYWLLNENRGPFMPLPPLPTTAELEKEARIRRFAGETIPAPANGSARLQQVVLKACAYAPKDRYTSATELLEALQTVQKGKDAAKTPVKVEEKIPEKRVPRRKNGSFFQPGDL